MNKKNFDLLMQSMREDVQQVRQAFHLSQNTFAKFMGVSVGTLRNWEQGRRRPSGAARVLLRIAIRRPQLFAEAVDEECRDSAMA